MAIYSLAVQTIKRSEGRSSTAAAAYRFGVCIKDERTGQKHDFTRRSGVLHSAIVGFDGDVSSLWNSAELAEKRKDSQVAREAIIALPHELNLEQNIEAMQKLAEKVRERWGVAIGFAIHEADEEGDQRNIHCHFMFTVRAVANNVFGAKTIALDKATTSGFEIEWMRQTWESIGNAALAAAQVESRIDCRSLKDQGLERMPQVHVGYAANKLERAGIETDAGNHNRAVNDAIFHRAEVIKFDRELAEAKKQLAALPVESPRPDPLAQAHKIIDDFGKLTKPVLKLEDIEQYLPNKYQLPELQRWQASLARHKKTLEKIESDHPIASFVSRNLGWKWACPEFATEQAVVEEREKYVEHIETRRLEAQRQYGTAIAERNKLIQEKYDIDLEAYEHMQRLAVSARLIIIRDQEKQNVRSEPQHPTIRLVPELVPRPRKLGF